MANALDLHTLWAEPDKSRLTAKQLSFRLPVPVAAKLFAIAEMFPHRSRTQLVGDLLGAAINDFEQSFAPVRGQSGSHPVTGEAIYEDVGPIKRYRELANRHYKALEAELGNKNAPPLFQGGFWRTEEPEDRS
jgi:hypothetical protein